jgi:hypothetical protein
MTGTARDVDLGQWKTGIGFHPDSTVRKQRGHEAARLLVHRFGELLHDLLPPGRDKSLVFTLLEDVLMRSNRALALDGPGTVTDDFLETLVADLAEVVTGAHVDPRIDPHKAEQLESGNAAA